jgi:hypothetical protein
MSYATPHISRELRHNPNELRYTLIELSYDQIKILSNSNQGFGSDCFVAASIIKLNVNFHYFLFFYCEGVRWLLLRLGTVPDTGIRTESVLD